MNYFNQILGGNIPITVIQSIKGFQQDQNYMQNATNISHYQINKCMSYDLGNYSINNQEIMNLPYGAYIDTSLKLDRKKVGNGLITIINTAITEALNISRDNLIKISKMSNKMSEQEYKLVDDTILKFLNNLSQSIINNINNLTMDKNMKELLVHIMHLTGITNKNNQDMKASRQQIIMIMELPHNFRPHKEIDIFTSLKLKLTPKNLKKCDNELTRDCVFDDDFLFKFATALMISLEHILGSIMNAVKYDKISEFYAFSVELSNQLANVKPIVIENLFDVGNKTKLSDSKNYTDLEEINKNIDQSKVIQGMSKLISDAINDVVNKNSSDLLRTIAISNKFSISESKGDSFSMTNFDQSIQSESQVQADFVQEVTTRIQNDIANKVKENIDNATKQFDTDNKKIVTSENASTDIGSVIGDYMDTAAKVLSSSAGNSLKQSNSEDITKQMKDTYDLNQSFKYEKNDEASTSISNVLKTENLSKCADDSNMANEIDLGTIDVTGPIQIDNVKQEAIVKNIMTCAFNQQIINDISSNVVNDFDKLITNMIENVNETKSDEEQTKVQGDIYAAGTAGAALLESTGELYKDLGEGISTAAEGTGKGISTAATGVGKGISTAATGVGEGVGSVLGGLTGPLIVGAVILALLGIGYAYYKAKIQGTPNDIFSK